MSSNEATVRDDVAEATHDEGPTAAAGGDTRSVPGQRASDAVSSAVSDAVPDAVAVEEQSSDREPAPAAVLATQDESGNGDDAANPTATSAKRPEAEEETVDGDAHGGSDLEVVASSAPVAPAPNPWADATTEVWHPPVGGTATAPPMPEAEEEAADDKDWSQEYSDRDLFTAIVSAPALSLAAFAFAVAGLLGGMIPESLPYLVQLDGQSGPVQHIRVVAFITLGFAIVSASLGFASLLRSIGSSLRWPRYFGGAAVLLAMLIALQSVLLLVLASLAPQDLPG